MFILPIGDINPRARVPIVTYALIALNVGIFLCTIMLSGAQQKDLYYKYGFMKGNGILSIFTSMFLHGGFTHIFFNMLYLWIFGDNIEDKLGSIWFILFYLAGGVAAVLAFSIFSPLNVPLIGASGAISAVLGAYLVLYPRNKIKFGVFFFFYKIMDFYLPAFLTISFWIIMNLFNGIFVKFNSFSGGVAYWAHIGGFAFGFCLIWMLQKKGVISKPLQVFRI